MTKEEEKGLREDEIKDSWWGSEETVRFYILREGENGQEERVLIAWTSIDHPDEEKWLAINLNDGDRNHLPPAVECEEIINPETRKPVFQSEKRFDPKTGQLFSSKESIFTSNGRKVRQTEEFFKEGQLSYCRCRVWTPEGLPVFDEKEAFICDGETLTLERSWYTKEIYDFEGRLTSSIRL